MAETWNYTVTFESDTQQPETLRGQVEGSVTAAVRRAVTQARRKKPTKNRYRSVVVLVAKVEEAAQATEENRDAA